MTVATDNSRRGPLLGCIADDVTGATDLAINLVQGGMRVVQVLGVPDSTTLSATGDVDAIVVALKSRSIVKRDAIAISIESLRALKQLGATRFYFKYCSTFDSTEDGNIGPVAESLVNELGVAQTIFCPAFPRAGRTVYRGHLFVGEKFLSESGMQHHPLNPMTDSNLVRFLTKQTSGEVGLLSYDTIADSAQRCTEQLTMLADRGISMVITDACDNSHLETLARAVTGMELVTGGSGLARYLPQAYRDAGLLTSTEFTPHMPAVPGRNLIMAGSCSGATNRQVQWMGSRCPAWHIDIDALMQDESSALAKLKSWANDSGSHETLMVTSTSAPDRVAAIQDRHGRVEAAGVIERFMARAALMLVHESNVRRLVLAGGETSGAVVRELGIRMLRIGPEICAGVPWTETIGTEPKLALALKSGNFGDENFFATALEKLS